MAIISSAQSQGVPEMKAMLRDRSVPIRVDTKGYPRHTHLDIPAGLWQGRMYDMRRMDGGGNEGGEDDSLFNGRISQ